MPTIEAVLPDTNDLGYHELSVDDVKPMGDGIYIQWNYCQPFIKAGKFVLARPGTYTKMHFVGNILAVGPDVDPRIHPGQRIVFDQFSSFEKCWSKKYGRVAILKESRQGALFAIIPKRSEIIGSELDYEYDR